MSADQRFDAYTSVPGLLDRVRARMTAAQIDRHTGYFTRVVRCFAEADGAFCPGPGMLSLTGQVVHVTRAIELFLSGLLASTEKLASLRSLQERSWVSRLDPELPWLGREAGFSSMDWAEEANSERSCGPRAISFGESLRAFEETTGIAAEVFGLLTPREMNLPLPVNPMRLETPQVVLEMLLDHTAHHRGAIAQYARLLRREPSIPYFEMSEARHEAHLLATQREQGSSGFD